MRTNRVQRITACKSAAGGFDVETIDCVSGRKETISCSQLVVATDPPAAKSLINQFLGGNAQAEPVAIPTPRGYERIISLVQFRFSCDLIHMTLSTIRGHV